MVQRAIEAANAAQQQLLLDAVHQKHRRQGPLKYNGTKSWIVLDDTRILRFGGPAEAKARKTPKLTLDLSGCKIMEHAHGKPFFYVVSMLDKQKAKVSCCCSAIIVLRVIFPHTSSVDSTNSNALRKTKRWRGSKL